MFLKALKCIGLITFLVCAFTLNTKAQTSNKGTDFWIAYAGHIDGTESRMTLFLSSGVNTSYTVETANGTIISSGNITANVVSPVFIDPNAFNVYIGSSDIIEAKKGIHITTDKPISVFCIISNSARTGGSLILPTTALGKDYYAFSYTNKSPSNLDVAFSEFTMIAVEDNTTIEIIPKGESIDGLHKVNIPFNIQLNKGDVYQYQSVADLSGSYIHTVGDCKPLAFFSGHTWAAFCEDINSREPSGGDNLYQQLFPVSSWGKNYITAPFYNSEKGNTDIIRMIVAEDNTTVTVNGSTSTVNGIALTNPYAKGQVITFFSTTPNVISADKPIAVAHLQTAQTCNLKNPTDTRITSPVFPGDPELTILNPVEQTLSDITVYSKLGSIDGVNTNIQKYYLNVIIKTADAASLKLDGAGLTGFKPVNNEYSYVIIDVSDLQAQHRLKADGGFVAIAYGYGHVESYAYLAGADVKNLSQNLSITSVVNNRIVSSGCVNEPFLFLAKLPYQTKNLKWDLGKGDPVVEDNSPSLFSEEIIDGKPVYAYKFPGDPPVFPVKGNYKIKVTAVNPNPVGCNANEDVTFSFDIYDLPLADFSLSGQDACLESEISFTDLSADDDGRMINKWLWEFGDGNTSDMKNAQHIYKIFGDFDVKMTAWAETGCASEPLVKKIHIRKPPIAEFSYSPLLCEKQTVNFSDQSASAEGAIVKWHWDFGDGQTLSSAINSPTHTFDKADTYTVTLIIETDKGCMSAPTTHQLIINHLPRVDFETPDFCLDDGSASFTDKTSIADGTESQFTYLWNFGDQSADAQHPNTSTQKNPSHAYKAAGNYGVTLTVKSSNGCEVTVKKPFTVNGSTPKAGFSILNPDRLCSNELTLFEDQASVDFGQITRIEWYFDYANNPNDAVIDETPDLRSQDAKQYSRQYPVFHTPLSKIYDVRMVAYSGAACLDEITKQLTLYAAPEVEFNIIPDVCEEKAPYQLTQAEELHAIPGTGVFTGDGISSTGIFDPAKAGAGPHLITYTYTSSKGCVDYKTQQITVHPTPKTDAGPDLVVLEGGETKIMAKPMGGNVTYKWIPAAGLNHDDILNPIASPETNTTYTLITTSENKCTATDQLIVNVERTFKIPNTFTPNGDGINDEWIIPYLDSYPNATVEIYNRYGQKIFTSSAYSIPFNGRYNGAELPLGTYYYIINPKTKISRKLITGSVTIIR